jgi:nuclear pore complex protein Nup205
VLLSVKILAKLSLSISPSTLVTLIERSVESERILAGFTQIISTESMEDITLAEEFAEQSTGAGAPSMDSESGSLEQANRLAALDLLIQDTELNRPFPNIAHFLLFGGKVGDQTIQDPHALGARQTSIHTLLELVNAGVPRLRGKGKEKGGKGGKWDLQLIRYFSLCLALPNAVIGSFISSAFTRERLTSQHAIFALERISLPIK